MARTSSKIVKTIPNQEVIKLTCFTKSNKSGDKYLVTQNSMKEKYALWKCVDDEFEKISTSDSPLDLDDIICYEVNEDIMEEEEEEDNE